MNKYLKDEITSVDLISKIYDPKTLEAYAAYKFECGFDKEKSKYIDQISFDEETTKYLCVITLKFLHNQLLEKRMESCISKFGCKLSKLLSFYLNKEEKDVTWGDVLPHILSRVYQLLILHKYIYTEFEKTVDETKNTVTTIDKIYLTQKGLDFMDPLKE